MLRGLLLPHRPPHPCSARSHRRVAAKALGEPQQSIKMANKLARTYVPLFPASTPESARFKILQWNMLADGLAQNGDFIKVAPEVLEWEARMPLIVSELEEADADIICVQELNKYEELQQHLASRGYQGCFLPKHCSPAARYHCSPDGLAIFHRTDRFEPVSQWHGQYYTDESGGTASQGFLQIHLRDRRNPDRQLVVGTTHLKAKEGADMDAIRLSQMKQLLGGMAQDLQRPQPHASNGNGNGNGKHGPVKFVPVILTGDFNATPISPCCSVLGAHPARFRSLWDVAVGGGPSNVHGAAVGSTSASSWSMDTVPGLAGASTDQQQQAPAGSNGNGSGSAAAAGASAGAASAASACSSSMDSSGALSSGEFSTWKFRSKGESKRIIDHMWWTEERGLRPISRWRMLNEAEIGPRGLPSEAYASDHIALCTEFEWLA